MTIHNVSKPNWMNNPTTEKKLIKLKNALEISEEEAKILLDKIDSDQEVQFDKNQLYQLFSFGLTFSFQESNDKRIAKAERKKLEEEEEQKRKIMLKLAENWFETLSDEQKEYVKTYGYHHCQLVAVG